MQSDPHSHNECHVQANCSPVTSNHQVTPQHFSTGSDGGQPTRGPEHWPEWMAHWPPFTHHQAPSTDEFHATPIEWYLCESCIHGSRFEDTHAGLRNAKLPMWNWVRRIPQGVCHAFRHAGEPSIEWSPLKQTSTCMACCRRRFSIKMA